MMYTYPMGCYDKLTKFVTHDKNGIGAPKSIAVQTTSGTGTKAYSHYGNYVVPSGGIMPYNDNTVKRWEDSIGPIFNTVFLFKGVLVCANSSGIYYSTDDGASVTKSNILNVSIKEFYSIDDVFLIALTTSNTAFCSSDGKTWVSSNLNNEINVRVECEDINKIPDGIYIYGIGKPSKSVGITGDYGKTWTLKVLPQNATLNKFIYTKISGKDMYVVGTSAGLAYFENFNSNGMGQSNIKTGNFDFVKVITFQGVTSIYASDGSGLYISTDGKTWTKDSVVAANEKIIGAEVVKSRIVFMTSSGNIYYKGTLTGYFK